MARYKWLSDSIEAMCTGIFVQASILQSYYLSK